MMSLEHRKLLTYHLIIRQKQSNAKNICQPMNEMQSTKFVIHNFLEKRNKNVFICLHRPQVDDSENPSFLLREAVTCLNQHSRETDQRAPSDINSNSTCQIQVCRPAERLKTFQQELNYKSTPTKKKRTEKLQTKRIKKLKK